MPKLNFKINGNSTLNILGNTELLSIIKLVYALRLRVQCEIPAKTYLLTHKLFNLNWMHASFLYLEIFVFDMSLVFY